MARPTNKSDLLKLAEANFLKLMDLIEKFDVVEQNKDFPSGTLNRNIRDVLSHLHHWHVMMMNWYTIGMAGQKPEIPAKGYTWKTTPKLNQWICENYKKTSLDVAKTSVKASYGEIIPVLL